MKQRKNKRSLIFGTGLSDQWVHVYIVTKTDEKGMIDINNLHLIDEIEVTDSNGQNVGYIGSMSTQKSTQPSPSQTVTKYLEEAKELYAKVKDVHIDYVVLSDSTVLRIAKLLQKEYHWQEERKHEK